MIRAKNSLALRSKGALISILSLVLTAVAVGCSGKKVYRTETTTQVAGDGTEMVSQTSTENEELLAALRTEWTEEYLESIGRQPVLDQYADSARNRALAREGALLRANVGLGRQIASIRVSATTTLNDALPSAFQQQRFDAVISNAQVIEDRFDAQANEHVVVVRMPRVTLIRVVEEIVSNR